MAAPTRIPFDSLTLVAVVREMQSLVGAKLQRIAQLDNNTILLGFYSDRREQYVLLSCDARFFRVHLSSRADKGLSPPPPFCVVLRKEIMDARLTAVRQVGLDRVLRLEFSGQDGERTIIAELMGKHSNLMLVSDDGKVLGAAKWVGSSKSRRPITPGRAYEPPPFPPREPLWNAGSWEAIRSADGASPFLVELGARSSGLEPSPEDGPLPDGVVVWLRKLHADVENGAFIPVGVAGAGAYPISVAAMGFKEYPLESLSDGLESHFSAAALATSLAEARASLVGQLKRVLLAREVAVRNLEEAADTASRAGKLQRMGELLMAFATQIPDGAKEWTGEDWEGGELTIPLDPELSPLENAQRLYDRAKRAKAGVGEVQDQLHRQREDRAAIQSLLADAEAANSLGALQNAKEEALKRRWLNIPTIVEKEDRPYKGHRIRELVAPGGWQVLYGENATSNDYLTTRVAKPNDWWLHVRGAVSAHVLIVTRNKPDQVQREALLFAARVAVAQSPSKHASLVAVDYTLRKYVRKARGSAPGSVLYEREKTLHVSA